jgi:hypothetical protein
MAIVMVRFNDNKKSLTYEQLSITQRKTCPMKYTLIW